LSLRAAQPFGRAVASKPVRSSTRFVVQVSFSEKEDTRPSVKPNDNFQAASPPAREDDAKTMRPSKTKLSLVLQKQERLSSEDRPCGSSSKLLEAFRYA
jgi:hypothetical protein